MHAIKPPGAECPAKGIIVRRLQAFDDNLLTWVNLSTTTQLQEHDQVYAFQPDASWPAADTQQDLPAPRLPTNGEAPVQVCKETASEAEGSLFRTRPRVSLFGSLRAALRGRGARR
eukprot:Rhum_TRINITY_DN14331_c0_g1::Rhum_TRINITY_DN14331_c0_g1_i1::g.80455::m.80455